RGPPGRQLKSPTARRAVRVSPRRGQPGRRPVLHEVVQRQRRQPLPRPRLLRHQRRQGRRQGRPQQPDAPGTPRLDHWKHLPALHRTAPAAVRPKIGHAGRPDNWSRVTYPWGMSGVARCSWWLALASALVAGDLLGGAFFLAGRRLTDLYGVSHITGIWMALAQCLNAGPFYPPLEDDGHYAGTRYMPLLFVWVAGLGRITGDYLL